MKRTVLKSGLAGTLVVLLFAGISCTDYKIPGRTTGNGSNSCEDCHTSLETLMSVYTPDTAVASEIYGITVPHYEPYDRVFMGGDGYDAFKASPHGSVGCSGCHNGDNTSLDKAVAHSGDFIKHPSLDYENKCGTCHEEITGNFTTSLHNGTGMMRTVALRSGLNGPEEFDQLPAHQIEGYNTNCAACHGTCGNCHVVRPPISGGGLISGHNFNKTPDVSDVCMTCHFSHGEDSGTMPDLHETEQNCISCHDGLEVHGNGAPVVQRYAYSELPQCEDCHTGLETENNYHTLHYGDFSCQVCHSQDYNNCGSCHIEGEGIRIPEELGFKIAANPLPVIKQGYDLALVRRTAAAPDNWKEYGVDEYASFDVLPTYNYTTPHNLLRWTVRTTVEPGQSCNLNCHIRMEADSVVNKELYLFLSDLEDWEINATTSITVDGKLPGYWPN